MIEEAAVEQYCVDSYENNGDIRFVLTGKSWPPDNST